MSSATSDPDAMREARRYIEKFVDDCIECGVCTQSPCAWRDRLPLSSRAVFRAVLAGNPGPAVLEFITRCALCGLCSADCLVDLNVTRAVMAARQLLLASGAVSLDDYAVMLVDRDVHLFTLYRDTYAIQYDDLKRAPCDTIFFPGCTLAAYAPELARAAYAWLAEYDGPLGFSEACCGVPLAQIGLAERAAPYAARLASECRRAGARRVVTACPECHYTLQATLPDLEIVSLYDLMAARHVQVPPAEVRTVHDSCVDRSGQIGAAVRRVLDGSRLVEMAHHGATTICCGSGGIVSMADPDLCAERARTRLAEFEQTGARECVTACMACAYRLQRAGRIPGVVHLLELAFGIRVDYDQVRARGQALWEGERGESNRALLAAAKVV